MTRSDDRTPGRTPSSLLPRLILFALTILVASATVGATRADQWLAKGAAFQSCESRAGAEYQYTNAVIFDVVPVPGLAPLPEVPDAHRAELDRWVERRCGPRPVHSPERPAAAAVAGVLIGGFALYWLIPYWRIRTRRLTRIGDGEDDGRYGSAAGHEVRRLAAAAGVTLHRVWLHPTDYSDNAVAFGHWRRRAIEIKSGMVSLHRRDPAAFRAIVGHELGHLHHRDVDAAYAMTGLWQAFLALSVTVTITGGVGDTLGNSSLEAALATAARLGALVLAVYLARNGMLRAREFHADAFAATIDGGSARSSLESLLTRQRRRWDAGWAWPFATHPSSERRRAALRGHVDGGGLVAADTALIGFIATFGYLLTVPHHFELLMMALRWKWMSLDEVTTLRPVYIWLYLPFLVPAGVALALGVWHRAWRAERLTGRGGLLRALARLAAGLWTGMLIGGSLDPLSATADDWPALLAASWWRSLVNGPGARFALTAVTVVALIGTVAVACRTIAGSSSRRGWSVLVAAYGAVAMVSPFPSALPGQVRPAVYIVVAIVPGVLGLVALARLRGRVVADPPDPGPSAEPDAAGSATLPGLHRPRWQRRLIHVCAVLVAVLAGRVLLALLSAESSQTPYALIVGVGLLMALTNGVKAAAAADEGRFDQQIVYGRNWLTLTGVIAVGGFLIGLPWRTVPADDDVPRLVAVVLITGVLAGIGFVGRETAADVYSFRHRRRARNAEPTSERSAAGLGPAV